MAIGTDDGQYHDDGMEYLLNTARGARADKKFADAKEINTNSQAGDFESRFNVVDTLPRMPPGASTELAGALKSSGSTETPERSVISKLTGSDGGERFQTWPERLVRSAFTLPGDVLSGKVQPGSIQEIERAADLAGLMVMGPAPVAAKLADGSLGSFAGVRSETIPRDKLYKAQNMELDMMHPDDIWDKTGFFRGADNRWRYEIPDKDAKLKMDAFETIQDLSFLEGVEADGKGGWTRVGTSTPQGDKIVPRKTETVPDFKSNEDIFKWFSQPIKKPLILREVMDHPELFKAYPELGTMKVEPLPEYIRESNARGETHIQGQVVGDTIYLAEGHPEYIRSVILHEIQHSIQHHEGFAYGGNQTQFLPKELPQAEKEFLTIKQSQEPKIAEELGGGKSGTDYVKTWERLIKTYQEKIFHDPIVEERLNLLKRDHPEIYRKLSNIVKSERLLEQVREEAFQKYQRLMGEVESRNVQARMNYSRMHREHLPPVRTEDMPRHLQINPK